MEVDLTGDTKDTIDRTMPDAGYYLAEVIDSLPDEDKDAQIVRYRVTGPTFVGSVIDDKIFNPEGAENEKSAEVSTRRLKLMLSRLTLIGDGDFGKRVVIDWKKAIGKKVVLHLTEREYQKDGVTKHAVNVDFAGVYPMDHDKIPVEQRERMGLKLLPGQTPTTLYNGQKEEPAKKGRKPAAGPGKEATPAAPKPAINVDDV